MPERINRIYCQRCLAANALGQESCGRCGTRLMLVVEPSSLRFEEETAVGGTHDEHLLERVSALENHLTRMAERMERVLDLLLRHARTSYLDHMLLETIVDVLNDAGTIDRDKLKKLWREHCDTDEAQTARNARHGKLRASVLVRYTGTEQETFSRLVKEGFDLLEKDERRAARTLERAAALAPDNSPLNAFLGEHFFRVRRWTLARSYLERALPAAESDGRIYLLLGLVCGDEGEATRAGDLLNTAVRVGGSSFAAHYALGRLSAAGENWKEALAEFKRALAARPSAEAHYVVAWVYYRLERERMAARHLAKALEFDPQYAEALYLLGLVHLRTGETARAREAFASAYAADAGEPRYLAAKRRRRASADMPPPPLFDLPAGKKRRLLTGGDTRLAVALQEDALRIALAR